MEAQVQSCPRLWGLACLYHPRSSPSRCGRENPPPPPPEPVQPEKEPLLPEPEPVLPRPEPHEPDEPGRRIRIALRVVGLNAGTL
jgi:hypothetical protein